MRIQFSGQCDRYMRSELQRPFIYIDRISSQYYEMTLLLFQTQTKFGVFVDGTTDTNWNIWRLQNTNWRSKIARNNFYGFPFAKKKLREFPQKNHLIRSRSFHFIRSVIRSLFIRLHDRHFTTKSVTCNAVTFCIHNAKLSFAQQ